MPRLRVFSVLLALTAACTGFGPPAVLGPGGTLQPVFSWQMAQAQQMKLPVVSAEGVVIMDVGTGRVLYAKNPHQHVAPASLTKIVTAIVALEKGKIHDKIPITISWEDAGPESSVMGLSIGEELTLEGLLYGLMLVSGNDAAIMIAKHIAGSEAKFVEMMNDKVRELGLRDTHFENPHGLDSDGHFSTPYDMAVLGRYGLSNPDFARIVGAKEERVLGRGTYPMRNINRIVHSYPGGDGIKTGYTDNAKQAVVASAGANGSRAIVVVMRSDGYMADATQLFDYTFQAYTGMKIEMPIYPPSFQDPEIQGMQIAGNALCDKTLVPRWQRPHVRSQVWVDPASGQQGSPVGWISFMLDNILLAQRPLLRR